MNDLGGDKRVKQREPWAFYSKVGSLFYVSSTKEQLFVQACSSGLSSLFCSQVFKFSKFLTFQISSSLPLSKDFRQLILIIICKTCWKKLIFCCSACIIQTKKSIVSIGHAEIGRTNHISRVKLTTMPTSCSLPCHHYHRFCPHQIKRKRFTPAENS